ncbi:ATP-citrate synthase alpha chain protein 2 [Porphyridium purpureum]|uniref:ATP citrate synthase n=1 Tax=Porphyridium purpureum TaxID=35688 RepID=A0A5J4YRZ4_PORPP|nr:ATP-citrate synthase alpha chain protein 2 [Porphyridium purpureum]|eukprot:POR8790..scf236_6
MARKKVREADGKRLVKKVLKQQAGLDVPIQVVQLKELQGDDSGAPPPPATIKAYYDQVLEENLWLLDQPLVVKPDMLFGKRGKSDLVALNKSWDEVVEFVSARMGTELEVSGVKGRITTFIVEPFVPHDFEFYLCIQAHRAHELLSFGDCGGVEIESNWDRVRSVQVPVEESLTEEMLEAVLIDVRDKGQKAVLNRFINAAFQAFRDFDFTLLESNPLTIVPSTDKTGELQVLPLDIRVELDSYATFKNMQLWNDLEFPEAWGRSKIHEEKVVQNLDDKSGASLKLSVLNPRGHIWTMVAGGGASVIYADTVVDLGWGDELANYAEYSGNPKQEETYLYARTLLSLATKYLDGKRRVIIVGGGVANFTDVAATFTGIIQALKDFKGKLQEGKTKIFVRRGGPNYKAGLRLMQECCLEIDVPVEVYGPDTSMTKIVELGIEYLKGQ